MIADAIASRTAPRWRKGSPVHATYTFEISWNGQHIIMQESSFHSSAQL